jgi:hypothetical protein
MARAFLGALAIATSLCSPPVLAAPPANIAYQGVLRLTDGKVVPNGEYGLEFSIHDAPGTAPTLYLQSRTVQIVGGLYNVILDGANLIDALDTSEPRYMQVKITAVPVGSGLTPPITLTPRQQLASVPYALSAPTPLAGSVALQPAVTGAATVQAALQTLALASGAVLNGRFELADPNSVRLAPGIGGNTTVAVAGSLLTMAGAVTFTLPGHLASGNEATNTWYYCYVSQNGATLEPHISSLAPQSGYHPAPNATWRHVGTFRNDASMNIVPFQAYRAAQGWEYAYTRAHDPNDPAMNRIDLGIAAVNTFSLKSLAPFVPPTARQALVRPRVYGSGLSIFLAHARHQGAPTSRAYAVVGVDNVSDIDNSVSTGLGWVELDTSLQLARGQSATPNGAQLEVLGWREEM